MCQIMVNIHLDTLYYKSILFRQTSDNSICFNNPIETNQNSNILSLPHWMIVSPYKLNQFMNKGIKMKFTKKLLIASTISTMAMISTQALADNIVYSNQTVLTVEANSKEDAFKQGMTTLNELKASKSNDLKKTFWGLDVNANKVALADDSYVTVAEKMNADGQLVYNGIVHVSLSYQENDSDN